MAVTVSPFTGCSVMGALVELSLAVCVGVGAETSDRAFLGHPIGFGLLVGSLRLRFDWMGYSTSSLALGFDSSMYGSVAINSCLVFGAQMRICLTMSGLYPMNIPYQFFWMSDLWRL